MLERFYLGYSGGPAGTAIGPWAMIGVAFAASLLLQSTVVYLFSGIFALIGVIGLIKGGRAGLFVELQDDHLLLNFWVPTRVPYSEIESANHPIFMWGETRRAFEELGVKVNRFFGGDFQAPGEEGKPEKSIVEIAFRKRIWVFVPFPPFVRLKRSWRLHLRDADIFLERLQHRMNRY